LKQQSILHRRLRTIAVDIFWDAHLAQPLSSGHFLCWRSRIKVIFSSAVSRELEQDWTTDLQQITQASKSLRATPSWGFSVSTQGHMGKAIFSIVPADLWAEQAREGGEMQRKAQEKRKEMSHQFLSPVIHWLYFQKGICIVSKEHCPNPTQPQTF
jgi:hypothetical protein